jgi:uncharacterized membrane protein YkvA (DUF1232 family)
MNINLISRLRFSAGALKTETAALYLAMRDPRTPWYARAIALLTLAYALSPIDLIPDFVPLLGYLDDLIIVPAGIALALRQIPVEVMEDARLAAASNSGGFRRLGWVGAGFITIIWLILLFWLLRWLWLLALARGL